uniref:Uncharacterized protein n=1 Tax=Arundo donax TaxID=35708 RepID=A0A0A8Y0L9_ARUDO
MDIWNFILKIDETTTLLWSSHSRLLCFQAT